jgi:hypothetical protein
MEIRDTFVVGMFNLLRERKIDGDKITLAALLILIGVLGRILLIQYANIETVLAICLLSGVLLGGIYCITIPLAVMLISDWWIYTYTNYAVSFGLNAILGLTFFTWSGFLVVGVIGFSMKKRFVYNMGGVAVLSGVGVLATIFYDAWTAFGFWYFIASLRFLVFHRFNTSFNNRGVLCADTLYPVSSPQLFDIRSSIYNTVHISAQTHYSLPKKCNRSSEKR